MANKCVIDIGSNTIKLFIAELTQDHKVIPLIIKRRMARLGKGINQTNKLPEDSMVLAMKYIDEYLKTCKEYNVDKSNILVTATAACRIADNGKEFIKNIKNLFDLPHTKILSGKEESEYTFLGALESIDTSINKHYYVIDIGGGSFQISLGTKDNYKYGISIPIGCNSVTEDFKLDQIINIAELDKVIEHFKNLEIEGLETPKNNLIMLGAGGTIKITQLMLREIDDYKPITLDELYNTASYLASISVEDRLNWFIKKYPDEIFRIDAGLTINRAEVILAGLCIVIGILKKLSTNELIVCSTDAKDFIIKLTSFTAKV